MGKKALASTGILALLLGLTACEDDGGEVTPGDDSGAEEQTEDTGTEEDDTSTEGEDEEALEEEDEEAEEVAEEADTDTANERPSFGDTYTYDDGLALTISQPEEFSPSETSAGGEAFDAHVQFDVTLENGTGEDVDPNLTHITASSGGQEAESAFDSAQGIEGPPSTTLLDGQSTTYTVAFGVADAEDLTVEFSSLDFENLRDDVIFVSE